MASQKQFLGLLWFLGGLWQEEACGGRLCPAFHGGLCVYSCLPALGPKSFQGLPTFQQDGVKIQRDKPVVLKFDCTVELLRKI